VLAIVKEASVPRADRRRNSSELGVGGELLGIAGLRCHELVDCVAADRHRELEHLIGNDTIGTGASFDPESFDQLHERRETRRSQRSRYRHHGVASCEARSIVFVCEQSM